MTLKKYCWIALALFVFDWILGMAQVRGIGPFWAFALFNFPFAFPYIWLESHWAGTRYEIGGYIVSELWSLFAFFFMVFAQAFLYSLLLKLHWGGLRKGFPVARVL